MIVRRHASSIARNARNDGIGCIKRSTLNPAFGIVLPLLSPLAIPAFTTRSKNAPRNETRLALTANQDSDESRFQARASRLADCLVWKENVRETLRTGPRKGRDVSTLRVHASVNLGERRSVTLGLRNTRVHARSVNGGGVFAYAYL